MTSRAQERKAELVEQLVEQVRARLPAAETPIVEAFLRRYLRDVAPSDLVEREPLDLYGSALAHLRFGQQRRPGEARIRAYNPDIEQHGWRSTHTVVEVVTDDMPFLVDSVGMELSRNGLGMHLIIHPVLRVVRDGQGRITAIGADAGDRASSESFMHFEVDRQSDPSALQRLEQDLQRVLGDVRHAVEDWKAMRERVASSLGQLEGAADVLPADELAEIRAFLDWLVDDHFTFLGFGSYDLERTAEGGLQMRLAEPALGILRDSPVGHVSRSFAALPESVRAQASAPLPAFTVTKANTRSTVHRATWLDFIGIKRYAADGSVVGESRFLGLFTSAAYNLNPRHVPLLRRKIDRVIAHSPFPPSGHAAKALVNILETYPRDELVQTSEDQLFAIATEILHLQDRQQIRLFMRPDPFGRSISFLVFVPRERYNTALREKMRAVLEEATGGRDTEHQAWVSEAVLARVLFTLRTPGGTPGDLDIEAIERKLVDAAHSWTDSLREALVESEGEEEGNRLFRQFGRAFPTAYQEQLPARAAIPDILKMDQLASGGAGGLATSLYRRLEDSAGDLRFKLIRPDRPVLLSDALPVLENMGLEVRTEEPSQVRTAEGRLFSIHDFGLRPLVGEAGDLDDVRGAFQQVFGGIWADRLESDGFNKLVLAAGLDGRQISILRAYCKYILQIGTPFSQAYIEQTLVGSPAIARALTQLFQARFDPALGPERDGRVAELERQIQDGLQQVQILDEDRILRRYLGLVQATLRTNAFQPDAATGQLKDYLSFKLDPARVPGMPLPRPAYEIFVYAPWMEGVHLRGGKVARGGLRWSDRREDFRTEILGLMKAQMVKNSVIVPVGAKGGFVVKRPPKDRAAFQEEGIRCYRTLLCGMLDITDNNVKGEIVPPRSVVRYDGDDPYLVVAADKGTATFSDIANAVSRDYGFWLDDAFASGGSAGYDHKGMGITAKGAWESVKRHFRELGMDPDRKPFTVIGIGDMSGDVFGNGMLLSRQIRLVAAFDHRHVFLDPDPDPERSFVERQRLFGLPRSSWADYDAALISRGGGIYPRTAKAIAVGPEVRAALGIEAESLSPQELMHAILLAPVDLFWNGGIGTYVKAAAESQAEAQDRANDGLRADGEELRCKVVAEGGNLGFTQKGRIAAAAKGVRINTDFIDNSAGVDCSDHEVNIKVLLGDVVAAGDMTMKQRDVLLASMTDEVGELVLRDNVLQNQALSMGQALSQQLLDAQAGLMRKLEKQGRLDRRIETLPAEAEIAERRKAGRGLTRPEAAVLLAYAKMTLYDDLLRTELPDRPYFVGDLAKYFPRPLRRRFREQIERHGLRREIVATWIANSLVNRGLDVFVSELEDETGADLTGVTVAYVATRDSFGLLPLWTEIEELGADVPAERQLAMLLAVRDALLRGTRWFLAQPGKPLGIRETVARYRPGIAAVADRLEDVLSPDHARTLADAIEGWSGPAVNVGLARRIASLPYLVAACDLVALGDHEAGDLLTPARVHFALDAELGVGELGRRFATMPLRSRWDRLALAGLQGELSTVLRRLTGAATRAGLGGSDPETTRAAVARWLESHVHGVGRYRSLLAAVGQEEIDLAMLAVIVRALGDLGRTG
ncbi:MAG TPA: NAD-glutamate dehydrogenase [Geminicoccaceae bacterium]|nr:NAD-glutamate dehydrogenase [Geminicoccus sp.]HMU48232.1 NAD-glutamate dehydrogenase [Geminicoccaceae bacterium]